jgi:hypothetical protein
MPVVIFQVNIEIGQDETFLIHSQMMQSFRHRVLQPILTHFCHVRKHFPLGSLDIERLQQSLPYVQLATAIGKLRAAQRLSYAPSSPS